LVLVVVSKGEEMELRIASERHRTEAPDIRVVSGGDVRSVQKARGS
jgi:hypothetical protein